MCQLNTECKKEEVEPTVHHIGCHTHLIHYILHDCIWTQYSNLAEKNVKNNVLNMEFICERGIN